MTVYVGAAVVVGVVEVGGVEGADDDVVEDVVLDEVVDVVVVLDVDALGSAEEEELEDPEPPPHDAHSAAPRIIAASLIAAPPAPFAMPYIKRGSPQKFRPSFPAVQALARQHDARVIGRPRSAAGECGSVAGNRQISPSWGAAVLNAESQSRGLVDPRNRRHVPQTLFTACLRLAIVPHAVGEIVGLGRELSRRTNRIG